MIDFILGACCGALLLWVILVPINHKEHKAYKSKIEKLTRWLKTADNWNTTFREQSTVMSEVLKEKDAAICLLHKRIHEARTDILQTARVSQIRLTGVDIITGDTDCPKDVEIHQQGIDRSMRLVDELLTAILITKKR